MHFPFLSSYNFYSDVLPTLGASNLIARTTHLSAPPAFGVHERFRRDVPEIYLASAEPMWLPHELLAAPYKDLARI